MEGFITALDGGDAGDVERKKEASELFGVDESELEN